MVVLAALIIALAIFDVGPSIKRLAKAVEALAASKVANPSDAGGAG